MDGERDGDKEKLREKGRQREKDTSECDCKPERSFEGEWHLSCRSSNPRATSPLFICLFSLMWGFYVELMQFM